MKLNLLLLLFLLSFFGNAQNQQVYFIGQSGLVNATSNCDSTGNNYYGNSPGFTWTDNLPAGTQVLAITIEYNVGINCSGTTNTPTLNTVNQSSVSYTGQCDCAPTTQTYITHHVNVVNYIVSGTNTYLLQGATTTGFNNIPFSLNGNFAKVTVTYGADDDAGIQAINLPSSFCSQTRNIGVQLKNFGTNTLNNVSIEWEINGTPQTTVNYNSTLATNTAATVVLASNYNFTNGQYLITARTTNPNNTTDGNTGNNELTTTINVGAFPPATITHSEVTPNSVYAINWTGDNAQTYDLEYGPFEFAIGTGTRISSISDTSKNISGINPAVNGYDVYVRSYCGSTASAWSSVYSFGVVPFFVSNETELNAALAAANNGDVIVFLNSIVITSQKTVSNKTIIINGQGYELSVPRPGLDDMGRFNTNPSNFRVLQLSSSANVTINNLTIKGGTPNVNGGAILVDAGTTLYINNSIVSNTNAGASYGGGAISIAGTMFMENSFVRRNAARYGGGILVTGTGRAYVEQSTMVENRSTATNGGGGAAECQSGSVLYFNNSTLSNNQSTEIGGAINNYQGTVYFINSSATGNVAFGSFNGGAIGNNGGNVWILNSLFAHNYRRTAGSVSNPTTYVLDDFQPHSNAAGIRIYNSIYQATLPSGLGVNTGNIPYTGSANGSNNTIFSGGLLSKITDTSGNEIGDQIFRPFLFNNQGSVAPTLQLGSFVTQPANIGKPTRFANNNNNPSIAYFDGNSWINILGTSAAGQEVLSDQVGNTRSSTTPTRGAIENELNATLYIVKVNGASGGTVNGGTIYGDVYASGTSVTLTAISNTGQQFVGWNYVAGGSGTASTANPYTFVATQDVTLVPVFAASAVGSYTITYIGNGNTAGTVPNGGTFSATTTISTSGTLSREGYAFIGWNTNSNGSGISYQPGVSYAADVNLSLYAIWEATTIVSPPTASAQNLCGVSNVSDLQATGTDLKWYSVAEGGTALNANTIITTATYYVSQSVGGVESTRTAVTVTVIPFIGNIGSISGTTNLASDATTTTYSIPAVNGATSYVWNVPAGMTLTSQTGPSISVALAASFTNGTVSVYALNNCGVTQTRTFYSTKLTGGIDFSVTGAPVLCANATATYTATTIADGIYSWTVPIGATIVSGQGTNSISVTAGANFTFGNIKATCVTSQYNYESNYAVAGVALPSFISGLSNVCGLSATTYSVENVPGTTYVWSLPSGMTVVGADNTASINVSISGTINGSITVQAQNDCGLSTRRRFTVNSAPIVGGINGANRVCGAVQVVLDSQGNIIDNTALNSYTYSVAAVSDADSYTWTVPTGATLVSGQGTTSITVSYDLATFESGTISVQAVNSTCGAGPERNLTVSTVTGTISGPTSLCGLTTATYSVPEDLGSGFIWSLPEGMSVTTGAGTSSITVTMTGPVYSNASLNVQFTTACGGTKTLSLVVSCSDYTNLAEHSCGAILSGTTSKIYALQRTGATAYEFEVTYDGTVYTTVMSNTSFFRLSEVSGLPLVFGGEYSVRVRVYRNGIASLYGTSCVVFTSSIPTTTLHAISCGATLSATTSFIYASGVVGASGYGFEVTYNGIVFPEFITNQSCFRLSQVTGLSLVFGGEYSIRVKIYSNGQSGSYGDTCVVYTLSIPTTTLHATSCGATLSATTSNIYAAGVAGAGAYEFEVTYNGTVHTTVISNDSKFRLSEVDGLPLVFGGQYTVRVRIHSNAQQGSYGASCSVYTPSIPNAKIILCGTTITYNDVVYANEIANATAYKFNIYDATGTTLLATMENANNYFDFTQMSYSFNTTYQVTVTIKIGTQYGEESSNCSITIGPDPGQTPSRLTIQDVGTDNTNMTTKSEMSAYPNPFSTSFSITPLNGLTNDLNYQVYDLTGKILESKSVKANEISSLEIGNNYPAGMYLVIVRQGATAKNFKMIKQ